MFVVAALAVGATRLDWTATLAAISRTDPIWFAAACGSLMLLPLLTAVEWRLIGARSVDRGGDFGSLFRVAGPTYFLQTYLNAAIGYGAAFLRLVRGRGWSVGQAIGLVTVDQVSEGISRIAFCGFVLSSAAAVYALGPASVGAILASVLVATYVLAGHGKTLARRSVARRLERMGHATTVLDDALAVIRLRGFTWGVSVAMVKKCAKLAAIVAVQRALGLEWSPATAVFLLAALECATVLPLVPGQLGVIESTAAAVYGAHGHSAEIGLSVGILYHVGLYLATALMGAAAAAWQAFLCVGDATSTGCNGRDDTSMPAAGNGTDSVATVSTSKRSNAA